MINIAERFNGGVNTDLNYVDRELKALRTPQPMPLGLVPTNNTQVVFGEAWTQRVLLDNYNGQNSKARVRHYTATWKATDNTIDSPVVQIGIGLSQYTWNISWSYAASTGGRVSESDSLMQIFPGSPSTGDGGVVTNTFDVVYLYPTLPTPPVGVSYTPSSSNWSQGFTISAQAFSNVTGTLSIIFNGEEDWYGN